MQHPHDVRANIDSCFRHRSCVLTDGGQSRFVGSEWGTSCQRRLFSAFLCTPGGQIHLEPPLRRHGFSDEQIARLDLSHEGGHQHEQPNGSAEGGERGEGGEGNVGGGKEAEGAEEGGETGGRQKWK